MSFSAYDSGSVVITFKATIDGDDLVPHKNIDLFCGKVVAFGAGASDANTIRVILASDSPGVGGGGGDATAANQTTMITSLSVLDDWDESDRAKVNLIAGQAGISAGAGGVAANTPRVTLASDDPAVASLSALDDWDESDRAKVNIVVGQAGVTAGAGAVAANTPRVTLASDDPAVASLSALDDWDESDRAKVNIIVGQAGITAGAGAVAANTPRVTHASDDPLVAAHAATGNSAQHVQRALRTTKALSSAVISTSSSGDTTLVGAVSGQTTRVHRLYLVAAGAVSVKFKRGSTDLTGAMALAANTGIVLDFSEEPWYVTGANEAFVINLSGAVAVAGVVEYVTS